MSGTGGFSLATPKTSGEGSGTTGGTPNNTQSIFNQPLSATSGASKPLFGAGGAGTTSVFNFNSSKPASSVFGIATASTPSWNFGGASKTPASTGQQPQSSQPASTNFFNQPSSQNSGAGAGQSPFGASTPQANKTTNVPSTTPAGNPPFSMFGNEQNKQNKQDENQQPSTSQPGQQQQSSGQALFGAKSTGPALTASSSAPAFQFQSLQGSMAPQSSGSQQANNASYFAPKTTAQGQSSTPATSGGSVFQQPPSTPAATAASQNLFSGLSQGQKATSSSAPGQQSSTASAIPKPGLGAFSLGGNTTSSSTSQLATTTSAPAFSGFTLGAATTSSGTTQPAKMTPAAAPAGGSIFNMGGASSTPASTGATTGAPATTGGLFNNLGGGSKAGTTSSVPGAASTTTSSAPAGGSIFPPITQTGGAGGGVGVAGTTGGAAAAAAPQSGAASTNGAAASTSGPVAPQQSRLANRSMDEILTMWSTSLATHQKTFQFLAKKVSVWDRMLVENSSAISSLYGRCFQAERDCGEVERQLSNVEHEQLELEALLDRYEGEVDRMLDQAGMGEGGSAVSGVDAERERTYKAAEACSTRLTEMNHSLTDMIEEMNSSQSELAGSGASQARADDPLAEIVRVLNGHLTQLQTVDAGASALRGKIVAAQREARSLSSQQGLTDGRDEWINGFGRSYLGRR